MKIPEEGLSQNWMTRKKLELKAKFKGRKEKGTEEASQRNHQSMSPRHGSGTPKTKNKQTPPEIKRAAKRNGPEDI